MRIKGFSVFLVFVVLFLISPTAKAQQMHITDPFGRFAVTPGPLFGGVGIFPGLGWGQNFPNQSQFNRLKQNQFDVGSTLARNLPWAGVLGLGVWKWASVEKKKLDVKGGYAVAELDGRKVLVHRAGLNVYDVYGVGGASSVSSGGSYRLSDNYPPIETWNGCGWDKKVKTDEDWVYNKTQEYMRSGYTPSLVMEMARRDYLRDLGKREALRKENEVTRVGLFETTPEAGLVSNAAGKLEKIDKELESLKNAVNTLSEGMEEIRKEKTTKPVHPSGEAKSPIEKNSDSSSRGYPQPYPRHLLNRPEDGRIESPAGSLLVRQASIEPPSDDNQLYKMDEPTAEPRSNGRTLGKVVKFPDGKFWREFWDPSGRHGYQPVENRY